MTSRWHQIEQNAREFRLDVHAVTRNFFGERGWHWLQDHDQPDAGLNRVAQNRLEKFKEEMMHGTQFYTNDTELEDRFALGMGAAAYAVPYGVGRLVYDGVLDFVEYSNWRITGHAYTPSHPEGRRTNGYILGAPLATPFVALAAAFEVITRGLGASQYGGHITKAAGKRAANMSKYTRAIFGEYDAASIKVDEDALKETMKNGWDVADRMGYATFPGVIALVELLGAVALTGSLGSGEVIGRALGVSNYGAHIIKAAGKRAANLSKYTRAIFGKYKAELIEADEAVLKEKVKSGWDVADRMGYATFPGVIALAELLGAVALTGSLGSGEGIGRALGVSSYGAHIIKAAGKRAANLSKYTRAIFGKYEAELIEADEAVLKEKVKSAWDVADRVGYVTFPGVIAAVEILGAVALTGTLGGGEVIGRAAGISERGAAEISLASKISANIMSRYFGECTGTYEKQALIDEWKVMFGKVSNGWDVVNAMGMFTLPLAVSALEMMGSLAVTGVLGGGELAGRVLGVSQYGAHIIKAAGKRAANLSKYTRAVFGKYDAASIQVDEAALKEKVKNGWDVADRVGYVTFPGVIALAELLGAVALTGVAAIGESLGRIIGFSERAISGVMITLVTCGHFLGFSNPAKMPHYIEQAIKPVRSWWDVCDVIGMVMSGGLFGAMGVALSAPLALIGISKSNYHRFNYYRHKIANDINERRELVVDRTLEFQHERQLSKCEESGSGLFFSKINLFNGVAQGLYGLGRFIVAPFVYALSRAVVKTITSGFFIIPIYRARNPVVYDLNNPVDKIRKRFADLKKCLDLSGHLPIEERQVKVEEYAAKVDDRSFISKVGFGLFSEGRRIMSLGHTPEEKVLSEFRSRLEEFVRMSKRNNKDKQVNLNSFFKENIEFGEHKQRFEYDMMVQHIKQSFVGRADKKAVEEIAELIKEDFENQMAGMGYHN